MKTDHERFMRIAIELAQKSNPFPNPRVGCVIVHHGKIIGKGNHNSFGCIHAEQQAIKDARDNGMQELLNDSTLYVTLEPCTFFEGKKTPGCSEEIAKSGIRKVVIGALDPNKNTTGIEYMSSHRIGITKGICEYECRKLIAEFERYILEKRPFITLKAGISVDGKLALDNGTSKWITSEELRNRANRMRRDFPAIMIGIGTALADDPGLTVTKGTTQPIAIVLDRELRIPNESNLVKSAAQRKVIIFHGKADGKRIDELRGLKVVLEEVAEDNGLLDLKQVFEICADKHRISRIMVEGGSRVHNELIRTRLFDELVLFIGNRIIGGSRFTLCNGSLAKEIEGTPELELVDLERVGNEIIARYRKKESTEPRKDWNDIYKEKGIVQDKPMQQVVEAVEHFRKTGLRKILDMGCGTGRHTRYMLEQGFEVHGCDSSENALKILKDRIKGVELKQCDMAELPYGDNYFDGIVCTLVIQHARVEKIKRTIAEMQRVLRAGGILFLVVPSTSAPNSNTGHEIEPNTRINTDAIDGEIPHHFFSEQEMRELFSGFEIIKLEHFEGPGEINPEQKYSLWVLLAGKKE